MKTDPIIKEIHKIRQEHAKNFNYDFKAIFNELKKQEKNSGRQFISLPIKKKVLTQERKSKKVA
jgi:hypothetical protein